MVEIALRKNLKMIVIDLEDTNYPSDEIHTFIENCDLFTGWWNYFPGVFIVESSLEVDEVANVIVKRFDDITCLVSPVETGRFSGRMNGNAWLWLMDESEETKAQLRELMIEKKRQKDKIKRVSKS